MSEEGRRWTFRDLLSDDFDAWASRRREEELARTNHLPPMGFLRKLLADELGVTPRLLDDWCDGRAMPSPEQLQSLCKLVGHRALKRLAISCGLGVYDRIPGGDQGGLHRVREALAVAKELLIDVVGDVSGEAVAHGLTGVLGDLVRLEVDVDRGIAEESDGGAR